MSNVDTVELKLIDEELAARLVGNAGTPLYDELVSELGDPSEEPKPDKESSDTRKRRRQRARKLTEEVWSGIQKGEVHSGEEPTSQAGTG